VLVVKTWPACSQLTTTQCVQLGQQGMCMAYVDPANTVIFPSQATVGQYCDSASINVCANATTSHACIGLLSPIGTHNSSNQARKIINLSHFPVFRRTLICFFFLFFLFLFLFLF
jgi:hypothetical protein